MVTCPFCHFSCLSVLAAYSFYTFFSRFHLRLCWHWVCQTGTDRFLQVTENIKRIIILFINNKISVNLKKKFSFYKKSIKHPWCGHESDCMLTLMSRVHCGHHGYGGILYKFLAIVGTQLGLPWCHFEHSNSWYLERKGSICCWVTWSRNISNSHCWFIYALWDEVDTC